MAAIDAYLLEVLQKRGSDLHFIAGDPARIRQYGDLMALRPERLDPAFVKDALYEIMPKTAQDRFEEKDGADFAYTLPEHGRFRVNVMRQLNGRSEEHTFTRKRPCSGSVYAKSAPSFSSKRSCAVFGMIS